MLPFGSKQGIAGPVADKSEVHTIFAQSQVKSKKRSHVLRCPIFCSKSSEGQKKGHLVQARGPGQLPSWPIA